MSTARRPRLGILLAVLIATIALSSPPEARAQSAPLPWNGIDRVVAFAEVHGAHTELLELLRETGIVDARDHWAAGNTHLVSLGDLLDEASLQAALGDLVGARGRKAILERRDALLALPASEGFFLSAQGRPN